MVTPEQEAASVMKYVLDKAGNPTPYYHNVPEGFIVPSVFFPRPEIEAGPDTLLSYGVDYQWFIKFFAQTAGEAYETARRVLTAIEDGRRLIPLFNAAGEATGERLRIRDPSVKAIDDQATGLGTAQIHVSWKSRRPYDDQSGILVQRFYLYYSQQA